VFGKINKTEKKKTLYQDWPEEEDYTNYQYQE
jgi:hypothetical protein